MLDFNALNAELNDPARIAQRRAEEEARQAAAKAKEDELKAAIELRLNSHDRLGEREHSFVMSCRMSLVRYHLLTEKQEQWLRDIVSRLRTDGLAPVDEKADAPAPGGHCG